MSTYLKVKGARVPPLESEEAHTLMQYMQLRGLKFTHIKNETGRPDSSGKIRNWQAIYDKQDGVSAGFPDFAIVLPGIGLLLIELKRLRGSHTPPEQLEWVATLNTVPGVQAEVCKGAAASIELIERLYPLALPRAKPFPTEKSNRGEAVF